MTASVAVGPAAAAESTMLSSPSPGGSGGAGVSTTPLIMQLVRDMARRAAPLVPALVLIAGLAWGADGALSAAFAVAVVLANLTASYAMLSWAGGISLGLLMAVALFGYLIRLAIVFAIVLAVSDAAWVEPVPLGVTLIVAHLGLLLAEFRYVSRSMTFPGIDLEKKD